MTLNELRYIVAIAQERHFGRAARTCFVSQPTLSVAVRKLERELQVTLFERGPTEVVLTPIGKQVVEQAQHVLESAKRLKQLAAGGTDPLVEPLRIGVIHTVGPSLLPHLIPALHDQVPDMPLIVEEGYTADLRSKLKQGNIDAIIISLPFTEPGVITRNLYDEPFVLLVPISHPWHRRDSIKSAELENETVLLLGSGHCFRDQVIDALPQCLHSSKTDQMQQTFEGGSIETIRHMVASGVGVTVVPCTAAGAEQYSRRLLSIKRIGDKKPRRRVALAWRKGYPRIEAIDVLAQAIISCPLSCVKMLP